jgi:hypothetical protein
MLTEITPRLSTPAQPNLWTTAERRRSSTLQFEPSLTA